MPKKDIKDIEVKDGKVICPYCKSEKVSFISAVKQFSCWKCGEYSESWERYGVSKN